MLFVILLLFVASSVSVEEEHVEFELFPDYYAMLNVSNFLWSLLWYTRYYSNFSKF